MRRVSLILLMFLCLGAMAFSEVHYWNTSAMKYKLNDRWSFGTDIEIRMSDDMYYKHIHFDVVYSFNRFIGIGISERESYIKEEAWLVEHKPMLNVYNKVGPVTNRFRVTPRIRDGKNIWRWRNKTTLTLWMFYVAFEMFSEKDRGGIYRQRYYAGMNIGKALSLFVMNQVTQEESIFVVGTKLTARY